MKRLKTFLFTLATLAILVFGLFFSTILSSLQNDGNSTEPRRFMVETARLKAAKSAQILDLFKLVSGNPETMLLERGKVLSAQQADKAALNTLSFMEKYGFIFDSKSYTVHKQTPILIYTQDGMEAAVAWICELSNTNSKNSVTIYIDDESGKMISFELRSTGNKQPQHRISDTEQIADSWADMCKEYYSFRAAKIAMQARQGSKLKYSLIFSHSNGEVLKLPFYIQYARNTTSSTSFKISDKLGTIIRFNRNLWKQRKMPF